MFVFARGHFDAIFISASASTPRVFMLPPHNTNTLDIIHIHWAMHTFPYKIPMASLDIYISVYQTHRFQTTCVCPELVLCEKFYFSVVNDVNDNDDGDDNFRNSGHLKCMKLSKFVCTRIVMGDFKKCRPTHMYALQQW